MKVVHGFIPYNIYRQTVKLLGCWVIKTTHLCKWKIQSPTFKTYERETFVLGFITPSRVTRYELITWFTAYCDYTPPHLFLTYDWWMSTVSIVRLVIVTIGAGSKNNIAYSFRKNIKYFKTLNFSILRESDAANNSSEITVSYRKGS